MSQRILGVGLTGTSLTELEREILTNTPPYAVVLFGRNISSVAQLKELVVEIKALSDEPPIIMIDQEGGRVDRLRELLPGLPSAEAFEEMEHSAEMVGWLGRVIGQALQYFDIEMNLAPVVDIRHEEPVAGLERRCFGTDAATVTRLARAFIEGQHRYGVAACLKHFPGIGGGDGNPHYGAMTITHTLEQLTTHDLRPYVELGSLAGGVMIGHGNYPTIEDPHLPATLSYRISTEILRDLVGFEGTSFSDDMEMHAVADLGTYEEICLRAVMAGNDVILFCTQIERVPALIEYFRKAAEKDPAVAKRVVEAEAKAAAFRDHCTRLQEKAVPRASSFELIVEELRKFCQEFEKWRSTRYETVIPDEGDRRNRGRSPGTGKTGREEWT